MSVRPGHRWPFSLRHGRVGLRPLHRRDERAWNEVRDRNAAWLAPWEATPPPGSPSPFRSFAAFVRDQNTHAKDLVSVPWVIEVFDAANAHAPSVLAGHLAIGGILLGSARWAHIGYWIDRRWAGHGLVPTAVGLATDYAFDVLGLHRMEICIRPENANSIRVVEKLGFRYEGRRPRYLHIAGDWRDHDVFVLEQGEVSEGVLARYVRRFADTPR